MVTVFVVDDEPVLHEIYRIMSCRSYKGHSVIAHAYDGEETVELYKQMSTRITKLYAIA
jgi:YesN/AraC family two-component response regulator